MFSDGKSDTCSIHGERIPCFTCVHGFPEEHARRQGGGPQLPGSRPQRCGRRWRRSRPRRRRRATHLEDEAREGKLDATTRISTRAELLALLDAKGRLSRPVTLAPHCWLSGLTSVTKLDGLTMAERCVLSDLSSLTSLDGLTMAERCRLSGLSAVTKLDGLTMAKGCRLTGLSPAMRAELAKLRKAAS